MTGDAEGTIAARATAAADHTVAAGTARLFRATCWGSPVPQPGDHHGDGVADFAQRRAEVFGYLVPEGLRPEGMGDKLVELAETKPELYTAIRMGFEPHRTIYEGELEVTRVDDRWIGTPGDTDGPRGRDDPLWPLDTLFGANDDAVEIGHEPVRDTATVHCRLTVDLLRADERLSAGVNVPEGPLRRLRHIPAELWLDASGRARRIAVAFVSATSTRDDSWIWKVTELWDFGVAVAIDPPPLDEVTSSEEITREASNRTR